MQITTKPMPPLPAGNPYLHDQFNMGQTIGKDLELMYANHRGEQCKYLILVNMATGERVKIEITQ